MPTTSTSGVASAPVECRVLGPIEALVGGKPVAIGGFRQRLVLALLASRAKTAAPTDWLVDAVWGDDPPRTARRTLQVYVTRLRNVLGGQGVVSVHGGYRLGIPAENVDWMQFEFRAGHGADLLAGGNRAAARELADALSMWRGDAYGDLAAVDALLVDAGRLEELRQVTVERRIEADLALGKAATLLPEIDELVVRFPLRERLRGLQMLALYQSGRQADALTAFQASRLSLVDGLGIEPSRALRELHERILRQDATLDAAPSMAAGLTDRHALDQPPARRELPSGVLTFVVCDIEGSTRLLRHLPDEFPELLDRHRQILREAFSAHHGIVVSQQRDGTRAVFADAADALLACVTAQQAVGAAPWPSGIDLRLRMGVHTGLAAPKDDDYVAMAAFQAARVADAARGGQVLVSERTASAVHDHPDISLTPIGRFRIPDFDSPESLSQLVVPGVDDGTPVPRALPAEGHNLTRPATSFVDRETEFEELTAALRLGGLVTIAGPGGVGKSRLAVEVGFSVADEWEDGVWRVAVDDLSDSALLTVTIAHALGMQATADVTDDALLSELEQRRALLVLDGCERHLRAVADLASDLLERNPRSTVLATTQEPLHIAGERVLRLRPLPTTEPTDGATAVSPAVQLFVDRAQAADAGFRLTHDNADAVVEVTRRLDGLPLAAEIAAARVVAFTPAELLESLEHSTRLLRSKDPSLPGRHRTLESLLLWSEGLLTPGEQATLRRLAVFAGPFTLAQAQVAAEGPEDDPDLVPDHVWSLVDHSIVLADTATGGTRYRMLDLVRRFVRQRLMDSGEEPDTALRVGQMFATQVGPRHASSQQWTSVVAADLDSVRSVAGVLYRSGDPRAIDVAGELSVATLRYLDGVQAYRVAISEAEGWLSVMPARPVRVAVMSALAMLHLRADEVTEAAQLAAQAQELKSDVGEPSWEPFGPERARGEVAIRSGSPDDAIAIAEQALQTTVGPRGRTRLFSMLGRALVQRGDLDAAAEAYHGELEASLELGDDMMTTIAQANAAELALRRGRPHDAAEHQLECLALARALGQPVFVAYSAILAARLHAAANPGLVVRLVTKAMEVLAAADHALYADDADLVAALLDGATTALSDQDHAEALQLGRDMTLDELARETHGALGDVVGLVGAAPSDETS